MKHVAIALFAAVVSCSHPMTATTDVTPSAASAQVADTTVTRGALTLSLHDFATRGGIMWTLPGVQAGPSTITVQSTRYGSLCRVAVDGSETISGRNVTIDIMFTQRTASCTSDIRALTYTAKLSIAPGTYDLAVVHHEDGTANTLVQRTVTVP